MALSVVERTADHGPAPFSDSRYIAVIVIDGCPCVRDRTAGGQADGFNQSITVVVERPMASIRQNYCADRIIVQSRTAGSGSCFRDESAVKWIGLIESRLNGNFSCADLDLLCDAMRILIRVEQRLVKGMRADAASGITAKRGHERRRFAQCIRCHSGIHWTVNIQLIAIAISDQTAKSNL